MSDHRKITDEGYVEEAMRIGKNKPTGHVHQHGKMPEGLTHHILIGVGYTKVQGVRVSGNPLNQMSCLKGVAVAACDSNTPGAPPPKEDVIDILKSVVEFLELGQDVGLLSMQSTPPKSSQE